MAEAILQDIKKRMDGALNAFHNDLKSLRTGRASSAMLDSVTVEVYGSRMPISQVATINVPEPRTISVQVWDKNNAAAVEKAIASSGLGFNPMTDGSLIRVPVPDLSEERRRDLIKVAHQYAEKSRIAIRNVRRDGIDALKKLQKDNKLTEDGLHDYTDKVQKLTDEHVAHVDNALAQKEKDVMEV